MEKEIHTTNVRAFDDRSNESSQPEGVTPSTWKPGYLARFPFIGAGAFAVVLLCTASSVAVLVGSDGVSQTVWGNRVAPNVVLSIINALSNVMLAVAVTEGFSIAWWRKAMKGATVAQLHQSWAFTISVRNILFHLGSWDGVALAALALKFAVVDGIFFQRATSTYIAQDPQVAVAALGIAATEFPSTGYIVSNNTYGAQANCGCFMIGDAYTRVVNTWETSNGFFSGYNDWFRSQNPRVEHCDGTCYTNIDAIGFEIDCTGGQPIHSDIATAPIAAYEASLNGSQADSSQWTNIPIFNSSFSLQYPEGGNDFSTLMLNLYYFQADDPYHSSDSNCSGRIFNTTCSLRPAMVTYPVKILNYTNTHIINGVSLERLPSSSNATDSTVPPAYSHDNKQAEGFKVGSYLNTTDTHTIGGLSTLGGLVNALSQFMSSTATISYQANSPTLWALDQKGILAQTMMYGPPNMGSCDCSFRNESLDTIVQGINQLAFLTAVAMIENEDFDNKIVLANDSAKVIGVGRNSSSSFRPLEFQQISDVIHYHTNYLYMGLGVAATIICMALVIPSYWRYGELGREVTLGPIEIATAFRAPMLHDARSNTGEVNSDVKEVIKNVGDRQVMYGFVQTAPSGAAGTGNNRFSTLGLAIEKPEKVRPVSGVWSTPTSPNIPSPASPRFKR